MSVASLPVVTVDGMAGNAPETRSGPAAAPPIAPSRAETAQETNIQETDIFAKIERLADLQQKGILTPDEFAAKKAELLSRL